MYSLFITFCRYSVEKNLRGFFIVLSFVLSFGSAFFSVNLFAQNNNQFQSEELVRINMNNLDVRNAIKWVAEQTNKNFIIDPRVKGKLSVLSSKPMTMDQAYQVFLTALDVYGFAVVESGNNVKVIPNAQARSSGLPLLESFTSIDGEDANLVIHVIKINNIAAAEVVTMLRPLVPQTGHLGAFPSSNSIIIADRANNINRLSQLIKEIDASGSLDVEVIQLKHATATDVISVIQPLISRDASANNTTTGVQLAADSRSNSILMSGNVDKRKDVRRLVQSMDRPLQGSGNTKVVYLNYIDAKELKTILDGMTGTIADEQKSAELTKDNISIEVSETTNALVITAPPSLLETMEEVIASLDIKRSQVLIDAVIVEVSDSFTRDLNVLWATNSISDSNPRAGVTAINLAGDAGTSALSSTDSVAPFLQEGLSWGFYRNGTLRALLQAIETDNNSNILSRPSIITLDNEEAEVLVGSNVPFITGSTTSASSTTTNPFQTIQREDVGITLKVTPKISKAETITLEIQQEVESVREEQLSNAQDLVTDKRSLKTKVLINDQDILVLGGLLDDRLTKSNLKVPILGDIPLLGHFFRGSSETIRKQNLMIFIKPTILDDYKNSEETARKRYEHLRSLQDTSFRESKKKVESLPEFEEIKNGYETHLREKPGQNDTKLDLPTGTMEDIESTSTETVNEEKAKSKKIRSGKPGSR